MNTQGKIGTLLILISVLASLLSGCVAPVYAAEAAAPVTSNDTCVGNGPFGDLFLVITQGLNPGDEQALGDGVSCYNSTPNAPQYWVVENPPSGPARSVMPTGGLSQEILEKVMDPSLGGYAR